MLIVNVLKFVFFLFAAQVGNIGNNQAVFQNDDGNTQVGRRIGPGGMYFGQNIFLGHFAQQNNEFLSCSLYALFT